MTQSTPRGDLPDSGPRDEVFRAGIDPLPDRKTAPTAASRDEDPFTGALLARWADGQYRRLEETQPELDLWSSIAPRLKD